MAVGLLYIQYLVSTVHGYDIKANRHGHREDNETVNSTIHKTTNIIQGSIPIESAMLYKIYQT